MRLSLGPLGGNRGFRLIVVVDLEMKDNCEASELAEFGLLTSSSALLLMCTKYSELCTSSAVTTLSRGFRGVRKTSVVHQRWII